MNIPEIVPISDLRGRMTEILAELNQAPVVLTQYGRPAAVMVKPDQWKQIQKRLEDLDDPVTVLRAELAVERGEEKLVDANINELEAMAKGDRIST